MRLIKSFLIPYLKRFYLMLLSVALVGSFGCGILIGLRNSFHSVKEATYSLIEECGYPDLYIQTIKGVDRNYLSYLPNDFNSYMGIKKAEYRTTYTTTFTDNKSYYSTRLIGYDYNSLLNHHLIEGKLNYSDTNVRMEYYFAKANGFKVGDKINAKMPNGETCELEISATVVTVESSIVKADPYSISSSRDFGYIYVSENLIRSYCDSQYFSEILINFQEGKQGSFDDTFAKLRKYIKEKAGIEITDEDVKNLRADIAYMTTYNDAEQIKFFNDAIKALDLITLAAPAVFFFVVLIVSALFLFQIVKQCRKDIGIMRALGERTLSITSIYLSLSFVVGVISWILGVGIGSLFTILANNAYGEALKLYPLKFAFAPSATFISLGIIVGVTLLTALLASLNLGRIKPVEAMKALPPTNNNTPLLTRTLFKKAPITLKVTISQTLRNISRYLFSGLCLLASAMLIFVALSLKESKNTMMSQLFSTRINYDVQVYFDNLPDETYITEHFDIDSNIKDKTLIKYLPSELTNTRNEKKCNGLINGVKSNQNLIRIIDNYKHVIDIPEHGIVLSNYHAYLLEAKVGDVIKANDTSLTVKAISHEYMYQVSYTEYDEYQPTYSRGSLLAKVKDKDAFFNEYKDLEHVTYISFTSVINGEFEDRLAAFNISSIALTIMAIAVGFLIVFNMMQTNLKEQKRTLATMRTLGYQRSAISNANLFVNIIQYIFAMIFAIPLGILLAKALLNSISIPDQIYPFPKEVMPYLLSMLIVLLFLLVSHYLVMNKMKKWNLPETVKERE